MNESNATKRPWAGYIITTIPALFLALDAVMKFLKPEPVVETTVGLGYPEHLIVPIGAILLISLVLYLIPTTAVLGAVLLTGYLGGAVATNFRVESPIFTHTLFPVYIGIFIWLGLYLREARLRALLPLRS
jgi:hypothetical protein